jgi:two-component system, chemotaxis family, chemotaxis protein CheY
MIIIDEGANGKLIQALKSLTDLEGKYCIRIHPIDGSIEKTRHTIITQAQEYMPSTDIYFCEDGYIFLLTQTASIKECRKAILAIATALKIKPIEHLGEIYDLALQSGTLLILLEKKLVSNRKTEEIIAKLQVQEQAAVISARKRQEILDQNVRKTAEQIAAQRKLRNEPILMIIEDDHFSRRLVESVLQKQYCLIDLPSAEAALSTYANIAPDVLFLDINLPDVTGHELLEKILALDPKAYVVMLSGNADRNNVIQAMQNGAIGFVAKPFSRDKLFQYIERCPTISKEKVI